jgi:hypothetical protein
MRTRTLFIWPINTQLNARDVEDTQYSCQMCELIKAEGRAPLWPVSIVNNWSTTCWCDSGIQRVTYPPITGILVIYIRHL